jgi:ATP-binding cassette subfamily B protein
MTEIQDKNNIKKNKTSQIMALLPYLIPYKREAILALIALTITSMMILCFGKAVKYIIDIGFVKQNQIMLNLILLGFIVAVLIMAIAGYYRSFLINF